MVLLYVYISEDFLRWAYNKNEIFIRWMCSSNEKEFETWSHYVTLDGQEFTMWTSLVWNSAIHLPLLPRCWD